MINKLITFILFFAISAQADSFKLGVILPLSGGLAEYGTAFQNGMHMAKEAQPELFDDIQVYYEDSRYDGKTSVTAFQKLRNVDKVDLIFIWGSAPTEAVVSIAEKLKYPLFAMGEAKLAVGKEYLINFSNPSVEFSVKLAKYLNENKHKKLAVVLSHIAYLEELVENLENNLEEGQTYILVDDFNPGDLDFKATIAKIKRANFDALGLYLVNGQISQFYRQMQAQNLELPTFGTDFYESTTEINQSGPAIEGAIYPHNIAKKEFSEEYIEKFGNDLQLPSASRGYDLLTLVGKIIKETGVISGQEFFSRLQESKKFQGVSGEYTFKESKEAGKYFEFPIRIKQIEQGQIKILQ